VFVLILIRVRSYFYLDIQYWLFLLDIFFKKCFRNYELPGNGILRLFAE